MDKKSFSEKTTLKHSFRRRAVVPGAMPRGPENSMPQFESPQKNSCLAKARLKFSRIQIPERNTRLQRKRRSHSGSLSGKSRGRNDTRNLPRIPGRSNNPPGRNQISGTVQ